MSQMQKRVRTALGVMVVLVPAIGYLVYGITEQLLTERPFAGSGWAEWLVVGFVAIGGGWFILAAIQGMQEMEEPPKTVTHNGEQMLQCIGLNPHASRNARRITLYLGKNHLAYTPSWKEKVISWNQIQQLSGTTVPTFHFTDGKTLTIVLAGAHFTPVIRTLEKYGVRMEQGLLSHAAHLEKEQNA